MKKDKRVFNGEELLVREQTKFEKRIVRQAFTVMYPNGVVINKDKITSSYMGSKKGSPGNVFILRYDGKVLFKRIIIDQLSCRYESPAFGDNFDENNKVI